MNVWELVLIFAVVMLLLAARYGFDFELMLRDKKTLLTVFTWFVVLYIAFVLVLTLRRAG